MLRIVLVGLLIPLGIGVLTAMELKTPPRAVVPMAQHLAQATVGSSDLRGALAKGDRLEITYAKSNPTTETEPGPVDERIPPLVAPTTGTVPRAIDRHRRDPKTKMVAKSAIPKSKPKNTDIKRIAKSDRAKVLNDAEPCRLSAFGGLRKALNSSSCEI